MLTIIYRIEYDGEIYYHPKFREAINSARKMMFRFEDKIPLLVLNDTDFMSKMAEDEIFSDIYIPINEALEIATEVCSTPEEYKSFLSGVIEQIK